MNIQELYLDKQMGIKQIAAASGLSPGAVRKRLIKQGVYAGNNRRSESKKTPSTSPPQVAVGPEVDTPPLDLWELKGDVRMEKAGGGFVVQLPAKSELVSPPLGDEWANKAIELMADLRLLDPNHGMLNLGVKDEGETLGPCLPVSLNRPFGTMFETKHAKPLLCGEHPRLYLRPGNKEIIIFINRLFFREVSAEGLIPVVSAKTIGDTALNLKTGGENETY